MTLWVSLFFSSCTSRASRSAIRSLTACPSSHSSSSQNIFHPSIHRNRLALPVQARILIAVPGGPVGAGAVKMIIDCSDEKPLLDPLHLVGTAPGLHRRPSRIVSAPVMNSRSAAVRCSGSVVLSLSMSSTASRRTLAQRIWQRSSQRSYTSFATRNRSRSPGESTAISAMAARARARLLSK